MERYEHPDMTATLDGQALPDLDEPTLQWVLSELEAYQVDAGMMEEVALAQGLREASAASRVAADALYEASVRLCKRARDRKHVR